MNNDYDSTLTKLPTKVPDLLGDAGLARVVADFIRDMQSQRAQLQVMQIANHASDVDPLPNNPDISYLERREQINDGIRAVCERFENVMDQVRAIAP